MPESIRLQFTENPSPFGEEDLESQADFKHKNPHTSSLNNSATKQTHHKDTSSDKNFKTVSFQLPQKLLPEMKKEKPKYQSYQEKFEQ